MRGQLTAIGTIWSRPKLTVRDLPDDRLFVLSVLYPVGIGIWLAYHHPWGGLMEVFGGRPQVALILAAACFALTVAEAWVLSRAARLFGRRPSMYRVLNLNGYCMVPHLVGRLLVESWCWLNPGIQDLRPLPVDWLTVLGIAIVASLYSWALFFYGLAVSKTRGTDEESPGKGPSQTGEETPSPAMSGVRPPWLQWGILLVVLLPILYLSDPLFDWIHARMLMNLWKLSPAVVWTFCILSLFLRKHWFWLVPAAIGVHWLGLWLISKANRRIGRYLAPWRSAPTVLAVFLAGWFALAIAGLQSFVSRERDRWPIERQTAPSGFRARCDGFDRYLIWVPEGWTFADGGRLNTLEFVSPDNPQTSMAVEILDGAQAGLHRGSRRQPDNKVRAEPVWPKTAPEPRLVEGDDGERLMVEIWQVAVGERVVRLVFVDHADSFAETKSTVFDTVRESFTPSYLALWRAPTFGRLASN